MSKFLFLYIFIVVFGLLSRYAFGENSKIWNFLSALDTSSAIALALLAGVAYYQMQRDEDEIQITFKLPNKEIDTRLTILRKDTKRSEILGLLRMIQINQGSFTIASLQNPNFLKELHKVQKDYNINKLTIIITDKELKQFKL